MANNATPKATKKRQIVPVTITVTLTANRINENGTFCSMVVKSLKGPNGEMDVVFPPRMGGGMFIKTLSEQGIEYLTDSDEAPKPQRKKFF